VSEVSVTTSFSVQFIGFTAQIGSSVMNSGSYFADVE
jgi:hypothetical protein